MLSLIRRRAGCSNTHTETGTHKQTEAVDNPATGGTVNCQGCSHILTVMDRQAVVHEC